MMVCSTSSIYLVAFTGHSYTFIANPLFVTENIVMWKCFFSSSPNCGKGWRLKANMKSKKCWSIGSDSPMRSQTNLDHWKPNACLGVLFFDVSSPLLKKMRKRLRLIMSLYSINWVETIRSFGTDVLLSWMGKWVHLLACATVKRQGDESLPTQGQG